MLKPICVKCQRFYRPHFNGRWFVEAMPKPGVVQAVKGSTHPEQWQPYKVWLGDEWQCQGCGHLIIVGTGLAPASEHYQEDFSKAVRVAYYLQVNDC